MNLLAQMALAFGATLILSAGTIAALLPWLRRRVMDQPNHRSMHNVPTPTGGGLGMIIAIGVTSGAAIGLGWISPLAWALLIPVLGLAALSFVDDLINLPILVRLGAHAFAVAIGLQFLPPDALVFQGLLPPLADRLLAGAVWVIFLNFMNFMDGIDGLVGSELAYLGLAGALVLTVAGALDASAPPLMAMMLAGSAIGFLVWNKPPAKLFMGDAGSVPLGFLTGGLLLWLAAKGLWAPALLLPLYVLADAGLTLAGRILRGERFWHAHRSHFYQRAAVAMGHGGVVWRVMGLNLCLLAASIATIVAGPDLKLIAVGTGLGACGLTLFLLNRAAIGDARAKN